MAKFAWGIELGTTSVKAVKMTTTKEDVEIVDIQIFDLPKVDPDLEQTYDERLQVALMDLATNTNMKKDTTFISIPGHQTFNRTITIPYLDPKKFRETVGYEAQNQFPVAINQILWDYQLVTPNPKPGEDVDVLLFAARKDTVNKYIDMCTTAGIKVIGVQIASLAIYNFVRYDQKFAKSGIIVDIGGDATDLLIIDDLKVWMRTLGQGSVEVTKVLEQRFKIPTDEAEKLKIKAAKSSQAEKIFGIMKPPLRELISEIQRSLGFYKSQNTETKLNSLLLMGSGANLLGLKKFFEQQLQFRIEKVSRLRKIQVGRTANPEQLQNNIMTLATSIGLALQGLGVAPNKINLVPEEVSFKIIEDSKFPRVAIFAILLIIAAFLPMLQGNPLAGWEDKVKKEVNSLKKSMSDNNSAFDKYSNMLISEGLLTKYTSLLGGIAPADYVEAAMVNFMNSDVLAEELRSYNAKYRPLKSDIAFNEADTQSFDEEDENRKIIKELSDGKLTYDEFYAKYSELIDTVGIDFKSDEWKDWVLTREEAKKVGIMDPRTEILFLNTSPIVKDHNFKQLRWPIDKSCWWIPSKQEEICIPHSSIASDDLEKMVDEFRSNYLKDYEEALKTKNKESINEAAQKIIDNMLMLEPKTSGIPYYWYRPRAYGIEYQILVPVDVAMTGSKSSFGTDLAFLDPNRETELPLHLERLSKKIKEEIEKQLEEFLPADYTFMVNVNTTDEVGKIGSLNQLITESPSSAGTSLLNLYKPIAIGIRVDYLDPNMGQVIKKSYDGTSFEVEVKPEFLAHLQKKNADGELDNQLDEDKRRTFQLCLVGKKVERLGIVKLTYQKSMEGVNELDDQLARWITNPGIIETLKADGKRIIKLVFKLDKGQAHNIGEIIDAKEFNLRIYQ